MISGRAASDIRLDTGGALALSCGLALTAVGALAELPVIALWGLVVLALVVLAYPLCLRHAAVVHAGALRLRCSPPTGPGGGVLAGDQLTLRIDVDLRGRQRFGSMIIDPVTSTGFASEGPGEPAPDLDDGRVRWLVPVRAVRVGPAFVHGAHVLLGGPLGFFRLRVYLPLDVSLRVLPRAASTRGHSPRLLAQRSERAALSPSARPTRGLGSDIRELREHHPGDPFKNIAWKATARRRQLIVKEFESDVSLSVYALLDIGPTMRWGEPGASRLDAGIDVAFHLARTLATGRDRYGLCTFDHEVFGFTRASSNTRMPQEVMTHLVELNAVVHEDFTDLSHADLVARVAEFMRSQDGLDLSLPDMGLDEGIGVGPFDEDAIVSRVNAWLAEHEPALAALRRHYFADPARSPGAAALRTWCRLRGVELPYRVEAVPAPREAGIERAIQKCIQDRSGSHTLVVVSDLIGIRSVEHLMPAVQLARAHRHRLVFICPEIQDPAGPAGEDLLERRLRAAFTADVRARRQQLANRLRARGLTVLTGSDTARALARRSRIMGAA